MIKLSEDVRSKLRFLAFYIANGTLCEDVIPDDMDYSAVLQEPSALEMIFAIWSNIIELDDDGNVTNDGHATRRAAQFVRHYIDSEYVVDPPFEPWELELV